MNALRAEVEKLARALIESLTTSSDEIERDYMRALAGIEDVLVAIKVNFYFF